jgi:hypothetical protein
VADLKIQNHIQLLLDGKGGVEAVKILRQLEAESRKTRKSLGEVTEKSKGLKGPLDSLSASARTLKNALGAIGIGLGAAAVLRFAKDALAGFAATERAANALRFQIQALGGDSAGNIARAESFIAALSEQTGILDDDLVPALNRAILTFDDLGQAQAAVRTAARFAAAGLGDVQSLAEKIATAFQTRSTKSLREFGIQTKDAAGETIEFADAIKLLNERAAKLPDTLDDAQGRLNNLARLWDTLWDRLGRAMDNVAERALNSQNRIADFLDIAAIPIIGAQRAFARIESRRGEEWTGGAGIHNRPGLEPPPSGDDEEARKRAEKAVKAAADAARMELDARIAVAEEGSDELLHLHLARLEMEREQSLEAVKGIKTAEEAIERAFATKKEDLLTKAEDHLLKTLEDERDAYQEHYAKLGESADAYYKERAEKEEAAALDAADRALELQIGLAQERAESLRDVDAEAFAKADEELQDLLEQRLKLQAKRELENVEEGGEAALKIVALYQRLADALARKHAKARADVTKAEAQAKVDAELAAVQSIAGVLGALFAKNKTVAVASAIVDTIAASVAAFRNAGGWPAGVAPMLLTLAQGYARVAQIRSVNANSDSAGGGSATSSIHGSGDPTAGRGFDDPVNDRAAYFGGRRWGGDAADNFTRGATDAIGRGWRDMMLRGDLSRAFRLPELPVSGAAAVAAGPVSNAHSYDYSDRSSVVVDARGAFLDRRGARKLARQIKRAQARDQVRYFSKRRVR